jgi:hypothetical protein
MNSLLQQFFMIRDFSDAVLQVDSGKEEPSENMLYQL